MRQDVSRSYDGNETEIEAEEDKVCLPGNLVDHDRSELHDGVVEEPDVILADWHVQDRSRKKNVPV
jgi:hypothetical protein